MPASGSTPPPGWASPPAPSEPAGSAQTPAPRQSTAATAIVWVLSVGAIVFGSIVGYQRFERSQDPTYYAVGYTVGAAVTVALLAMVISFLVRRARRIASGPSPLALMAISLLAVGIQHAYREQQADHVVELVERCQSSDPNPFGPPPAGVSLVEEEVAGTPFGNAPLPDGLSPQNFVTRRVMGVRGSAGLAAAYPGLGEMPDELHRFIASMRLRRARDGTTAVSAATSGMMSWTETAEASIATGRDGCWAIVVVAPRAVGTTWALALMSG